MNILKRNPVENLSVSKRIYTNTVNVRNAEKVDETGRPNDENLHSYALSTSGCLEALSRVKRFYSSYQVNHA